MTSLTLAKNQTVMEIKVDLEFKIIYSFLNNLKFNYPMGGVNLRNQFL
jgi:hypothetical protein